MELKDYRGPCNPDLKFEKMIKGREMIAKAGLLVLVVLTLFLLMVPACGEGGEEATRTSTATPTAIVTPTATPMPTGTTTPTTTPSGPVKIGAIQPWSGPAAMAGLFYADPVIKLVEKQVNDMGGILGGRSLKVVPYDNRNTVADSVSGVKKLVLEDKVSALVFGASSAQCTAISDAAEELKVLFVSTAPLYDLAERKFTVQATLSARIIVGDTVKLVTEVLKPRTVAIFADAQDSDAMQYIVTPWEKGLEAAGSKIVYSVAVPANTADFMPYLTKVKYFDPDVLLVIEGSEQSISMAKQVTELGGWGHTQVVAMSNSLAAAKLPSAKGWLILVLWHPGLDTPASVKFKEDFQAVNGKLPDANHVFYYLNLWTAIQAIERAGTAEDTEAIARTARSGNLEFDTPVGRAHFTTDGDSGLGGVFVQIQEGGTTVSFKQ